MNDLNLYVAAGNLCKDANFHNEDAYFTIASNRSYRDAKSSTGWSQNTTYVPCRVNGKLAQVLAKRLKKGNKATITGTLGTYIGKQDVFVKTSNGEMKSISDNQFIIDITNIDIDEKDSSNPGSASSQNTEDQAPM